MKARGIAYAFATASVCLSSLAVAQLQLPSQSDNSSGAPATSAPARQNSARSHQVPGLAALHKRIDIVLSDASLNQAIAMIARQSGLRIDMDPRVKSTATVTVEAANVPIYRVLEMILHQPGTGMLMISPKSDGILIEPIPTREAGKITYYKVSNPPWNDTWYRESKPNAAAGAATSQSIGAPVREASNPFIGSVVGLQPVPAQAEGPVAIAPTTSAPAVIAPPAQSGGLAGLPTTLAEPIGAIAGQTPQAPFGGSGTLPAIDGQQFGGNYFAPQVQPGFPGGATPGYGAGMGAPAGFAFNGSMSVMVTALSDKSFVVTEPGLGPKNEVGVYLTVYRVEGEKIREVSTVFHRSANGGRTLSSRVFGRGMGGGRPGALKPAPNTMGVAPIAPLPIREPGGNSQLQGNPPVPGTPVAPAPQSRATPNDPNLPEPAGGTPRSPDKAPAAGGGTADRADPIGNHTPGGDVLGGGSHAADDPFNGN